MSWFRANEREKYSKPAWISNWNIIKTCQDHFRGWFWAILGKKKLVIGNGLFFLIGNRNCHRKCPSQIFNFFSYPYLPIDSPFNFREKSEKYPKPVSVLEPLSYRKITINCRDQFHGWFWVILSKKEKTGYVLLEPVLEPPITNISFFHISTDSPFDFCEKWKKCWKQVSVIRHRKQLRTGTLLQVSDRFWMKTENTDFSRNRYWYSPSLIWCWDTVPHGPYFCFVCLWWICWPSRASLSTKVTALQKSKQTKWHNDKIISIQLHTVWPAIDGHTYNKSYHKRFQSNKQVVKPGKPQKLDENDICDESIVDIPYNEFRRDARADAGQCFGCRVAPPCKHHHNSDRGDVMCQGRLFHMTLKMACRQ